MDFKIIILFSLIVGIVFTGGCLNESASNPLNKNTEQSQSCLNESASDSLNKNTEQSQSYLNESTLNPLNKTIEPFQSSYLDIAFENDLIVYKTWTNDSRVGYAESSLPSESDLAFYGTIQTISPSCWSTPDKKPPAGLYNTSPGRCIYGSENGTIPYNCISVPGCDDYIYTPVTFEINDLIKGKKTKTVTVCIEGGQIDNYIMLGYPTVWDLKEGQQYLVYLKNDGTGNYTMMPPSGLFVVLD